MQVDGATKPVATSGTDGVNPSLSVGDDSGGDDKKKQAQTGQFGNLQNQVAQIRDLQGGSSAGIPS